MPELEVLEAKVPVRTPRLVEVETEPQSGRFAPVAGWFSGPVFSRARDIFAANMTELLDRAEDPARMIRMIILEMEETLVEIRATAARSIAGEGLAGRVRLARGDATDFDPRASFGVAKFDRVFVSYALSMIPPWRLALGRALDLVAPSGSLHVVDFGGFDALPGWFGRGMNRWLADMESHNPPPMANGRVNRLKYMTQIKSRPPTFVLWVSQPDELPDVYRRYIVNGIRRDFKIPGVPIRLLTRASKNPYTEKK